MSDYLGYDDEDDAEKPNDRIDYLESKVRNLESDVEDLKNRQGDWIGYAIGAAFAFAAFAAFYCWDQIKTWL